MNRIYLLMIFITGVIAEPQQDMTVPEIYGVGFKDEAAHTRDTVVTLVLGEQDTQRGNKKGPPASYYPQSAALYEEEEMLAPSPPPVGTKALGALRGAAEVARREAARAKRHIEDDQQKAKRKAQAARILKQAVRAASGLPLLPPRTKARAKTKWLPAYTSSESRSDFEKWFANTRADDHHAEETLHKLNMDADHEMEEQTKRQRVWANWEPGTKMAQHKASMAQHKAPMAQQPQTMHQSAPRAPNQQGSGL